MNGKRRLRGMLSEPKLDQEFFRIYPQISLSKDTQYAFVKWGKLSLWKIR